MNPFLRPTPHNLRALARAISVIGMLTLLAACSSPAPLATPSPVSSATLVTVATATTIVVATAPSPDEYAIYGAIISANWPGQAQLVIQATTTTEYVPGGQAYVRGYVASQLPGLQKQTTDSFLAANQSVYALTNRFHLASQIVFLSKADFSKFFQVDYQTAWRRYFKVYPGSQGLLAFSRAGFNSALDQALVYYQNQKGLEDGAGYVALMSRDAGGWVVKKQLQLWIS